jgi:hypothetical protein
MKSIDSNVHDKKSTRECQYCIFWFKVDEGKKVGLCELNGKGGWVPTSAVNIYVPLIQTHSNNTERT